MGLVENENSIRNWGVGDSEIKLIFRKKTNCVILNYN